MKTMGLVTLYWAEYSKCNVLLWGCKVSEGIDVPCLGMNPPSVFYRRMHCNISSVKHTWFPVLLTPALPVQMWTPLLTAEHCYAFGQCSSRADWPTSQPERWIKKSAAAWCIELKIKAGRMSGLHWFLYIFHHPSPHFITVKLTGLL